MVETCYYGHRHRRQTVASDDVTGEPAITAAVIAVQLFKGHFFYCNDDSKNAVV